MRRMLIAGLVFFNAILAGALVAKPAQTQIFPMALFNCCEAEPGTRTPFCCSHCCWFVPTCGISEDCQGIE